jgi:SAM-dependent methyltransferase
VTALVAAVRRWVRRHERLRRPAGRIVGSLSRLRTRRLSVRDRWSRSIAYESDFWDDWLATHAFGDEEQYRARLDPAAPVSERLLAECLESIREREVRILDVGAGPLTTLGKTFPGKELAITAVDPLADDYDALLARAGVTPPVRTVAGHGERLLDGFGAGTFHVAYAANALDHSYDPMLVIRNMVEVVRPGGYVVLLHRRNEAETKDYLGLHQWNFDVRAGRLVIWNRDGEVDVAEELGGVAQVAAALEGGDVACLITRAAVSSPSGSA